MFHVVGWLAGWGWGVRQKVQTPGLRGKQMWSRTRGKHEVVKSTVGLRVSHCCSIKAAWTYAVTSLWTWQYFSLTRITFFKARWAEIRYSACAETITRVSSNRHCLEFSQNRDSVSLTFQCVSIKLQKWTVNIKIFISFEPVKTELDPA